MSTSRRELISQLFHTAVKLPPDERIAFLQRACEGDRALQEEIESLLRYESGAARFLETPAADVVTNSLAELTSIVGRQVGPYQIVALLGAGGMGEVYLADDTKLRRPVAIKALRGGTDDSSSSRLLDEARAACALSHPNICTVYEVVETGTQSFLVMEHVMGHALSMLIPRGGQPIETVLHYGAQVADAVAHAHERGIVHRDLKPSNAMITPEGRVKVLDFGIAARRVAGRWDDTSESLDSFTHADGLAGTLAYMAPEQFREKSADARSDIWALGVMLYEMVTGELPFRGQSSDDLRAAILTDQPVFLPARVPAALTTTIMRCLAKEPERRYQRASEVRAALEAIQSGSPVPAAEPSRSWRRVRPWATALLLMIFVAVGWRVWNEHIVERNLRVPIEYRNIPRQLEFTGDPPTTVDVRVRGSSARLRGLGSRNIVAVLDLANALPGSRLVQLPTHQVRAPDGVEVAQVVPDSIALDLAASARRKVPIVPALQGEPAPGFVIGRVTSDPPTVEVLGPSSRLKQLTGATTVPVDVTGSQGPVRDVVAVGVTDSALRLAQPQHATVTVDVVAPVERELSGVSVRWRNLGTGVRAQVQPALARVTARGRPETLADLRAPDIDAFVNLAGLGVGRYNLQVQIDPSESYRVSKISPSVVIVTIK